MSQESSDKILSFFVLCFDLNGYLRFSCFLLCKVPDSFSYDLGPWQLGGKQWAWLGLLQRFMTVLGPKRSSLFLLSQAVIWQDRYFSQPCHSSLQQFSLLTKCDSNCHASTERENQLCPLPSQALHHKRYRKRVLQVISRASIKAACGQLLQI